MSTSVATERPAPGATTTRPALSVVVACVEASRSVEDCLASIGESCRGLDAEIIVVDASRDDTARRAEDAARHDSRLRVLRRAPDTLTPELWAEGFRASHGSAVAFTTGHCVVGPGWARALLRGLEGGDAGVGGPLALAPGTSVVDWAIFYLRYSSCLDAGRRSRQAAKDILGDNAAYRRASLDRHAASLDHGFWEVDFHRRLAADGESVAFVPGSEALFARSYPLGAIVRHRFAHGRHFGAWRVRSGARAGWQVAIAAPLVPALMLARIARRVLAHPAHRLRFAAAAPVVLALATAWAAGEAWGAAFGWSPSLAGSPLRQRA